MRRARSPRRLVDAVLGHYREHVSLTPDETERLPDAIRGRPTTIDCWSVAHGRMDGARAVQRLDRSQALGERIAARARRALAAQD